MNEKIEKRVSVLVADSGDDDMVVTGYAAVFDSPTVLFSYDGIDFKEQIARGAFDGCDFSQCCFKYNHSDDFLTLARTANNTLQLLVDDKGLRCIASLAPIQAGKDLYSLIKRKDISQMSFAFVVSSDTYDDKEHLRTINKISAVYDVSAVDIPAYQNTNISARKYFLGQNEVRKDAAKREKLIIRTYL